MAVSVICDTRDTCPLRALFVWPLHLFLTLHSNFSRSELCCSFFSQSVSQPLLQSLQFRNLSANQSSNRFHYYCNHYCNRYIPEISQSTNQSINQSRPPTTITYQGLLPADLSLEIDVFLDLLSANLSLKSHRIARPVTNTLLGLLPAYLSLEFNVFLGLFASSSLAEDERISRPVCQQLSRWRLTHFWVCLPAAFSMEIDTYLGLFASISRWRLTYF